MSAESWPPALKDFVAKCLGQMTDFNKAEAKAELRQVIYDASTSNSLWTTDWGGVQLQSLLPKPINFTNLKRKHEMSPGSSGKKPKKNAKFTDPSNDIVALNRRAERFKREHDIEQRKTDNTLASRVGAMSWEQSRSGSPFVEAEEADPNVIDWDRYTIVGTSQEIFKDYLRLTTEPKPDQIRPLAVLKQTLEHLKKRWKEKSSYAWVKNQFKSLRQDLTVQRIKNEFTVQVYEIHARIALESSDMVEYNQCQATLKTLYELGIPGKVEEFTAYRILMLIHGRNRSELNLYVGQLTRPQKADAAVIHAMNVQRAIASGNYHSLFVLYMTAPNMGAYLMDHFVDRERIRALMVITRAYKVVPLSFLSDELAFDSPSQTREFLTTHGVSSFTNPNIGDVDKVLDCKIALPILNKAYDDKFRKVGIKGAI